VQSTPAAPKAAETPKAAASQTISGTIANLDVNTGMVTLTIANNQSRQLTVAKRLLEGLRVGDRVKVDMVGQDVQAIHKETRG
jgi:Cu/Ag efflux protein CusF